MQMSGEQLVDAPRQEVWKALNDPDVLRASIPGCQSFEKEADDRYTAVIEAKVGPIGARFKSAVKLTDLDPPNSYTIVGEGNAGIAGTAKGSAKVRLSEEGERTRVSYTVDAEVGGRLAQLGGPIIDATAKQLAGRFFNSFGEVIAGTSKATGPAVAAPVGAAPPQTSAKPASTPSRPGAPRSTGWPIGWIVGLAVAALAGFLIGIGLAQPGSAWLGLAIGLLVILVAGAAFEYGRRTAAPVVMLDSDLLKNLLDGVKK